MGRNGQDTLLWEGKAAAEPQGTPPQSPHSTAWLCPLGPWHSSAWKVSLKRKQHILSKCWPASAANSLVRDIGIIWELDGMNICARQMLGQGGVAGAAEPPSPLHCLQMRHGMPEEGWCNLTHTLTHLLLQGDPASTPNYPGEEAGTQGIHHGSLLAAHSLWVNTGVTGLNGTGLAWRDSSYQPHISCPPAPVCRRLP